MQHTSLDMTFFTQQQLSPLTLFGGNKCHGGLRGQPQPLWAVVGCQPKLNLGTGGSITPMAGEQETLL